jgi:ribonuclease G
LSIAGRFIVLVPFSDRVSISQKIEDKAEKSRLKKLVHSIKPKGFGVIVRTVADGKKSSRTGQRHAKLAIQMDCNVQKTS